MKLCASLLLLALFQIEATVNHCPSGRLQDCFCGKQFYNKVSMFVVNCTGLGFTDTKMLTQLPEQTGMLIFTGNHIPTLNNNVFGKEMDLSMLTIIDMSNNGITEITGKAFHRVTTVERLILNHNNISISKQNEMNHPRVFSNFENLLELHLTNAFADNTDAALADDLYDVFLNSNLTKLIKLHLEQNEIKDFHKDEVFCNLRSLQHLYLGDNNIPSLNFDVKCLHKLTYLDLEGNNITSFSDRDLETFEQLTDHPGGFTVDLDDNPFRCDSAINNLYDWLLNTKVTLKHKKSLECHQEKYGTKYILNLRNQTDSKHAKVSQALTVLLVILVVVLVTLLGAYIYLKKESVKERLTPIFDAVSRKVQYTTIESQDV